MNKIQEPVQPFHTIPIVTTLDEMTRDVHGWCPADQLYTLFSIAYLSRDLPGQIVEIGSWCGKSTCALALAAQITGNTKVHCIDLWPAKSDWYETPQGYSFKVNIDGKTYHAYHEQFVWKEPFEKQSLQAYKQFEGTWEAFRFTMSKNKFENIVEMHRGNSDLFLANLSPDFKCKMAFIDGDHGYDAARQDIQNIERILVPGAWICFDDAFSCYEGVDRAIRELIIESGNYDSFQQMTRKCFAARKKNV